MKSPRLVFFLLLFICTRQVAYSTHLMGGSLTYAYVGISSNNTQYHVTLKIYRYCDQTNGNPAALDGSMMLGVYTHDTANAAAPKDWFETDVMPKVSQQFITPPNPNANCNFTTTVCVEEGIYETDIFLPVNDGGYHLVVERCCRNGNIVNLSSPGMIGQTYYCFVPPDPIINSSPVFPSIGVPFICIGDTTTVVNNATDPDGDVLEYALVAPYVGYSSQSFPTPDPAVDNNPYGIPIPQAIYNAGYSATQPFGAGGVASINAVTGQTSYSIPNQGFYVVVMEIREYRNGVLIASVRRDIQLIAIPCPQNDGPVLSAANGSGTTSYVITEGQTLCFPVTFTDADGDSLWLTSTGNIFNGAIVNPPAILANANDSGTVTSQFCWTSQCGQAQAAPYQFNVNVLDNGCPPQQTNQVYSITVNPNPAPPVAQVSIAANPAGPVCAGTNVTFTATPSFGGTMPVYQWQVNGLNAGTNSATFTTNTLNSGDVVTCIMTSNSSCVIVLVANSNPIVMTVDPPVVPAVSISASPPGTICYGTNVTFTANALNAGSSPSYQWQVNGINSGTNSPVFSSAVLVAGNIVSVIVIPNSSCPGTATNSVTMSVLPIVTPSVTITANPGSTICPWTNVTFTATPVNGGTLPSWQWQVNGINTGTNSPVFSPASLQTGDVVNVVLTSNAPCTTANQDTSNLISITVLPVLTPAVSITASPPATICAGTTVTFTANVTNGGLSPSYQWTVNGMNAGTGATFSGSTFQNGDVIHLAIVSNANCLSTPSAGSNSIAMSVIPVYMPAVSIVSSADTICPGTNVIYTATPVNGGTAPVYHWTVNGFAAGTNSPVFSSSTLTNLDNIKVTLASSIPCPAIPVVNSNLIVIHVRPNLTPNVTISANPYPAAICHDSLISYTASWTNGGASPHFQWMLNGAITGSDTGVYTSHTIQNGDIISVVLTSNALCVLPPVDSSNKITTLVDYLYTPAISISANPGGQFCDGTMITYTAAVAHEGTNPAYHWQLNGVNINATGNTFITDQLQNEDTLSCVLTSSIICPSVNPVHSNELIIDRLPPLQPVITGTDEICTGKEASFLVTATGGNGGPYYYLWDNNLGTDSSYNLSPGVTTTYSVIVSDSCSKWRSAGHTIEVNPLPVPEFTVKQEKPTILNSFIDFVDKSSNTAEWLWNFGDATTGTDRFARHIYPDTGFYEVQLIATSSKGCVDSITHPLYIEDVTTVYFPNSFTPNADGKNDYFAPAGHEIPSYEMTVYNRWGGVVFFTNSSLKPWTGLVQKTGALAPEGSYIYIAKFNSGAAFKKQVIHGQVTLIR